MINMLTMFLADFYKTDHISQYPKGTKKVWSNWTPRSSRTGIKEVVNFGEQYFIKTMLQDYWKRNFFDIPLKEILDEYREVIRATLGVQDPRVDHIAALHQLGYLPIDIYALPEGVSVPLRIPMIVITNTVDHAYWLPNFLETIMSAYLWKAMTSATTAQAYRKIFMKHARLAGETDFSFVDWQGHDFSFRGMSALEDAVISGMGHLLSFSGTDTIPAIIAAHKYYNAPYSVGGSVPATEHSVMCSGTKENEYETFRRLIEEVYQSGIVSIVSDTWDLWNVLTNYVPRLRKSIHARNGKVVFRPDSGDPVKIMTGDDNATFGNPEYYGALRLLYNAVGAGLPDPGQLVKIRNAGLIYGDSITLERADEILTRTRVQGFSPYNIVLGIGSYTYEYVTRDTYGFAMKATAVQIGDEIIDIYKNPKTDDGVKKSLKGIPIVREWLDTDNDYRKPHYIVKDHGKPEELDDCSFAKIFSNGDLLIEQDFLDIRQRVRDSI